MPAIHQGQRAAWKSAHERLEQIEPQPSGPGGGQPPRAHPHRAGRPRQQEIGRPGDLQRSRGAAAAPEAARSRAIRRPSSSVRASIERGEFADARLNPCKAPRRERRGPRSRRVRGERSRAEGSGGARRAQREHPSSTQRANFTAARRRTPRAQKSKRAAQIKALELVLPGVDFFPLCAAGRDGFIREDIGNLVREVLAALYLRGSKMGLAVFRKLLSRPKHRQVTACRRRINCIGEPEENIDGKNKQATVLGYSADGVDDGLRGIVSGGKINLSYGRGNMLKNPTLACFRYGISCPIQEGYRLAKAIFEMDIVCCVRVVGSLSVNSADIACKCAWIRGDPNDWDLIISKGDGCVHHGG
jgi:hypothetical protein